MSPQIFLAKYVSFSHKRIIFYVLCLSISWFLQLLGFVLPGWGYLKGDMLTIHVGLWYRVTCKKTSDCQTVSMVTGQTNQDNDMLEYQIETFLSLAACAIAITTMVIHVRYVKNKNIISLDIGMLACLLSGVLALIASCKMGYKYKKSHNEQLDGYGRSVYKSPYSLYLTGSGGIIACLITFVLVIENHIFIKNMFKRYSVISNQHVRSEQPMVAIVNTDASYNSSQSDGAPSQCNTTSTNVPVSAGATVRTTNDNHYMYAWPSTKTKQGSKPATESSSVVVQTDDAPVDHEYGNVMLANGQRFIMNDIYNIQQTS